MNVRVYEQRGVYVTQLETDYHTFFVKIVQYSTFRSKLSYVSATYAYYLTFED